MRMGRKGSKVGVPVQGCTECDSAPITYSPVKCWNSNSMGTRGYIKEGLELTPMSSFNVEQGCINSRPDSCGVPKWVWTDGPGFSLCAAPLESLGPVFQDERGDRTNKRRSGGIPDWRWQRELTVRGGVRIDNINGC